MGTGKREQIRCHQSLYVDEMGPSVIESKGRGNSSHRDADAKWVLLQVENKELLWQRCVA
jgi:hypothetical protein